MVFNNIKLSKSSAHCRLNEFGAFRSKNSLTRKAWRRAKVANMLGVSKNKENKSLKSRIFFGIHLELKKKNVGRRIWYFVTEIVLTYCEKKLF